MMTKTEVMELVEEYKKEEAKTIRIPHYYIHNGIVCEHPYPDIVRTNRYNELFYHILNSDEAKIFKCDYCGEMIGYFDLESWCCDFDNNEYVCNCCYEQNQLDDEHGDIGPYMSSYTYDC